MRTSQIKSRSMSGCEPHKTGAAFSPHCWQRSRCTSSSRGTCSAAINLRTASIKVRISAVGGEGVVAHCRRRLLDRMVVAVPILGISV